MSCELDEEIGWHVEVIGERLGMSLTNSAFSVENFRGNPFGTEHFPKMCLLQLSRFH